MDTVLYVVSCVFWGLLVLSVLVFVHEGGHYLAARAFGVRVTEFMLGLPCRARLSFKSKKVGTEIGVTPVLLGGYNRISGMEPNNDELLGQALRIVCDEGRIDAEELAERLGCDPDRLFGILETLNDWASIEPYYNAELGETPGQKQWSRAIQTRRRDAQGLTEFDRAHDFSLPGGTAAGEPCLPGLSGEELLARERSHTYLGCGFVKRLVMLVAGPLVNIVLAFFLVTGVLMGEGVTYSVNVSEVGGVTEGGLAEAAGLQAGDVIESVNGEDVKTWTELTSAMSPYMQSGEDLVFEVKRGEEELTVTVDLPEGEETQLIGIYATTATYHPDFISAASATLGYGAQVAEYAVKLIMPQHTMEVLEESSSVVGISVMASEAATSGLVDLVYFAAAISMSLGFMNLLPIPPLDGGKILIEIIQKIARRELSARAQNAVSYVGLAFFMFIFVFAVRNDILRFVIG